MLGARRKISKCAFYMSVLTYKVLELHCLDNFQGSRFSEMVF